MSWLVLALLSPLVYSLVNFIDKYVIEKAVKDYFGMPVYTALVAIVFGSTVWLLAGRPLLPLSDAALILSSGALTAWGALLYFKAISEEETSSVIVVMQLQPVLILVLAAIFLDEKLHSRQLWGFVLVLIAAMGVTFRRPAGQLRISAAWWQLLAAVFLWSASVIVFKFVANLSGFAVVLVYESWGLALGGLLLYLSLPRVRRAFHHSLGVSRRAFAIIFFNEGLYVLAKLLGFLALSRGPVALVSVVSSSQVFYGLLLGYLLTRFKPQVFRENLAAGHLLRKVFFAALLFAGILLVRGPTG